MRLLCHWVWETVIYLGFACCMFKALVMLQQVWIASFKCVSPMHLVENAGKRQGLVTYMYMAFQCTSCSWKVYMYILDRMATRTKLLNAREVLGSRLCGLGRSGIEVICGMLSAPLPSPKQLWHLCHAHLWAFSWNELRASKKKLQWISKSRWVWNLMTLWM